MILSLCYVVNVRLEIFFVLSKENDGWFWRRSMVLNHTLPLVGVFFDAEIVIFQDGWLGMSYFSINPSSSRTHVEPLHADVNCLVFADVEPTDLCKEEKYIIKFNLCKFCFLESDWSYFDTRYKHETWKYIRNLFPPQFRLHKYILNSLSENITSCIFSIITNSCNINDNENTLTVYYELRSPRHLSW